MAYSINPNIKKKYEKKIFLKLKLKYWRLFSKFRKILRILKKPFYKKIYSNNISFDTEIINKKKFLERSIFYKDTSYCFVENVLDESFYSNLLKNFPPKEFFLPPRHLSKQYNFGFKWINDVNETDLKTDYFHEVNHFFQVLKSTYFIDLLNLFNNDQTSRLLDHYYLTLANKGAILLPHKDSIAKETLSKRENALSMVFFIKGKRNSNGNIGGTGIYLDNEFKKPIFIPKNLNNSLLIYRPDANFFHGFDKMEEDSERFTVNAQFTKV
jgi:hypothetical protein